MKPDRQPCVLVVEDEFLIALLVKEALTEAGFRILGPVARLDEAVELAGNDRLDAALLDIELSGGKEVYPAAEILAEHNVPFAFISSQPPELVEDRFVERPMLQKPFRDSEVQALAARLIR
ncbi:response regulator [Inquilinus limosus]|uniref:response regulator n=1 Tax=Inquilinus limosus TaxID=171674 RepID=UPI003F142265